MKFEYDNQDGKVEYVQIASDGLADIVVPSYDGIPIYPKDIPKLINALQQAYEYIQQQKEKA
jgi:hypothetical protein